MRLVLASLLTGSLVLVALLAASPPAGSADEPLATMDRIFEAVAQLLPASLDEERFADPQGRSQTLAALNVLVESADQLGRHAEGRDPSFRFLAESLAVDVRQIKRRFEHGRYAEARFFLSHLTETCVACHSRLPNGQEFPLAGQLLESIDMNSLTPTEQARLQVATRQFKAALTNLEGLLADPKLLPARMDVEGYFHDYLALCIRVEQDLPRARKTLEGVAKRSDTSIYLVRHLQAWIRSLEDLEKQSGELASLARARELIARAQRQSVYPADQQSLVYYLAASSVLYRWIDARGPEPDGMAEALYLLGVADAAARRSYWVSQAEFFFEWAIRSDPGSPFAKQAYALLEEYTVLGFSGSAGVFVPHEMQATLDELRALIDAN
jgi:hypothetical protein